MSCIFQYILFCTYLFIFSQNQKDRHTEKNLGNIIIKKHLSNIFVSTYVEIDYEIRKYKLSNYYVISSLLVFYNRKL